jgi:hypothetical protein
MSLWIRTFSTVSFGDLNAAALRDGIAKRLTLLTYLFCPDDEEDPDAVMARLRIEPVDANAFRLFCSQDASKFVHTARWKGDRAREEANEELERVTRYPDPGVETVRRVLTDCAETIGFQLTFSDRDNMTWPVGIAAAAHYAELVGGVINADDEGWMVPSGKEVSVIVEA